jgi:hypothetical protein
VQIRSDFFPSISLNIHIQKLFQIRLVDISYVYNRELKCIQILQAQLLEKVSALKTGRGGDYKPNHNIKMDIKKHLKT